MDFLSGIFTEIMLIIRERWYKPSTLVILLFFVAIVLLVLFSEIDFSSISFYELGFSLLLIVFFALFWFISTRLPKTPRGKIGFMVAIVTETKEQEEKILKDFVITLRTLLQQSNYKQKFFLSVLPKNFSQKIESGDDAIKCLKDSKATFILFGRARTRNVNGKENHFLDLQGAVIHKPINSEIQQQFSAEFNELFPARVRISSEGDIFLFEFTAELVNVVARYIIGIASMLSGDISYAQNLFEDLEHSVISPKGVPSLVKIKDRIPSRLALVYTIQVNSLFDKWGKTRRQDYLDEAKPILDKLARVAPTDYHAHLKRAIWLFVKYRDIAGAKKEIQKCQPNSKDGTWRYNQAFLSAYEGNLQKAVKEYHQAFKAKVETVILKQVESFIEWILDEEPEKVQLYFCLGLLYLFKLEDKPRALIVFQKFLDYSSDTFDEQQKQAKQFIQNISKTHSKPGYLRSIFRV